MKSKASNLLGKLVPGLFFSIGAYILVGPWFQSILEASGYPDVPDILPLWSIGVLGFSIVLGFKLSELENKRRFAFLLAYAAANLLIIYPLGWPLIVYLPFTLVLLYLGLRFRLYHTTLNVRKDIALGVLVLFLNLAFSTQLTFEVGIADVVLFFISAIGVGAFFNLESLKDEGFSPQYRLSFLLLLASAGAIFLVAFMIGVPLEGGLFNALIDLAGRIYGYFADFLALLLYPVVWILRPLFALLEGLEFTRPEQTREREGVTGSLEDINEGLEGGEGLEGPIGPYILLGLACLVLVVLLIWLTFRLSGSSEEEEEEGVVEESESLLSISELASGARDRWLSLRDVFSRGASSQKERYRGDDPLTRIRRTYFRFARRLEELTSFGTTNTPRDYLLKLRSEFGRRIEPQFRELTEIYNRARYGGKAAEEDADRVEKLWNQIMEIVEEKEEEDK